MSICVRQELKKAIQNLSTYITGYYIHNDHAVRTPQELKETCVTINSYVQGGNWREIAYLRDARIRSILERYNAILLNDSAPKDLPFVLLPPKEGFFAKLIRKTNETFLAVVSFFMELGLTVLCMFMTPLALFPDDHFRGKKTPILFIHGYLHNKSGFLLLRYRLLRANLGPTFALNLTPPFFSIANFAKQVDAKVKQIEKLTGRDDLIIIAHSMGGLVAGEYKERTAAGQQKGVKAIFTLGTPLNGTFMAWLGPGECSREMHPGSLFVNQLRAHISQSRRCTYYHVASQRDGIIIPWHSALTGKNYERELELYYGGHLFLLFSPTVASWLCDRIREIEDRTSCPI